MKTFKILLVSALCLSFASCSTSKKVTQNSTSQSKVISESKESYRDTIFYTKKAEASLKIPLSEFKNDIQTSFNSGLNTNSQPKIWTQKNGNAKATVKIVRDSIYIKAECDSIALVAKIKAEYHNRYLEDVKTNDQFVEEKTKLNWQLIISLIAIAFIAGFVTKSLIKISI